MATTEQAIVDKVLENLQAISIANGYSFDVDPDSVIAWNDAPLAQGQLPAIVVRDLTNEVSEDDEQEHILTFELVFVNAGASVLDVLRDQLQDIVNAFSLIADEETVAEARLISIEKTVEKEAKRYVGAMFYFTVHYFAEIWEI